ncbi:MAG: hypothetical protein LBC18_10680 [Opitutaceae bacterium]|jgi:hypothetical protein|nr:hypothetical protein [Opitutaceae bacterium]
MIKIPGRFSTTLMETPKGTSQNPTLPSAQNTSSVFQPLIFADGFISVPIIGGFPISEDRWSI